MNGRKEVAWGVEDANRIFCSLSPALSTDESVACIKQLNGMSLRLVAPPPFLAPPSASHAPSLSAAGAASPSSSTKISLYFSRIVSIACDRIRQDTLSLKFGEETCLALKLHVLQVQALFAWRRTQERGPKDDGQIGYAHLIDIRFSSHPEQS